MRRYLVGISLLVVIVLPFYAVAQWSPDTRVVEVEGTVRIDNADGGTLRVGIDDSVRLDVSATTPPDTYLAVAGDSAGSILRTETTGQAGGPVITTATISGIPTVSLTQQGLNLLAGVRSCSYLALGNPEIGVALHTLPRAGAQTGITIQAHDFGMLADYVSCWPGAPDAGPFPNCDGADAGIGFVIHEGGALDIDIIPANEVNCLVCVHGGGGGAQTAHLAGAVSSCAP